MSNEFKDFTIQLTCNEAVYRALVLMLRHCKYIGNIGTSRNVTIHFDGDGHDAIYKLEISEEVAKSDVGCQKNGSFWLDTDRVYHSVPTPKAKEIE